MLFNKRLKCRIFYNFNSINNYFLEKVVDQTLTVFCSRTLIYIQDTSQKSCLQSITKRDRPKIIPLVGWRHGRGSIKNFSSKFGRRNFFSSKYGSWSMVSFDVYCITSGLAGSWVLYCMEYIAWFRYTRRLAETTPVILQISKLQTYSFSKHLKEINTLCSLPSMSRQSCIKVHLRSK